MLPWTRFLFLYVKASNDLSYDLQETQPKITFFSVQIALLNSASASVKALSVWNRLVSPTNFYYKRQNSNFWTRSGQAALQLLTHKKVLRMEGEVMKCKSARSENEPQEKSSAYAELLRGCGDQKQSVQFTTNTVTPLFAKAMLKAKHVLITRKNTRSGFRLMKSYFTAYF